MPWGINDAGVIAGSLSNNNTTYEGYVLNGSPFTYINAPGATSTTVTGINDSGDLVGFYEDSAGKSHGFIATPNASVPEPASLFLAVIAILPSSGLWLKHREKQMRVTG